VRPPRMLTASFAAVAIATAFLISSAPSATAATAAAARQAALARPARAAAGPSGVQARGADLVNAVTRRQLWSRALNTQRPMASITKVMTALVVIRAGGLNRTVRIPAIVVSYVKQHGASSAGLRPGDVMTVGQLLEGLLLPSGCDAARVLADTYGPRWPAFVRKMNATARALGLRNTHFANFDGLPWPTESSTLSTPGDLITLGLAAMRLPAFRAIVRQRSYRLARTARHHAYLWQNTNQLLDFYPGAFGIKTGFTPAAGYSLLFEAERHGRILIGVVLDSSTTSRAVSFADAARMLNWGFALARAGGARRRLD
jgi:serine-type D-Ala-D-Ala carboxypeptidase (penicillin-binding protein 5/6)